MSSRRLQGEAAVVTGVCSPVGRAAAEALLRAGVRYLGVTDTDEAGADAVAARLCGGPATVRSFGADVSGAATGFATPVTLAVVADGAGKAVAAPSLSWDRTDDILRRELLVPLQNVTILADAMQRRRLPQQKTAVAVLGSRLVRFGTGVPTKAAYGAAKQALQAFTGGVRRDHPGVSVSVVNPSGGVPPEAVAEAFLEVLCCGGRCDASAVDLLTVRNVRTAPYAPAPLLEGHVAFVTGGSNGIGRAIGVGLASQRCSVVLLGRNDAALRTAAAECATAGAPRTLTFNTDVTSSEGLFEAVEQTVKALGRITVVVCSAGVNRRRSAIDRDGSGMLRVADPKVWAGMFDVNVTAATTTTQLCLPYLAEAAKNPRLRGGPTVIYISSIITRSPWAPSGGQTGYHTTKAAVSAFSSSLHKDVERFGIKSVCINAAVVDTELGTRAPKNKRGPDPRDLIQKEDVSDLAVYTVRSVCCPGVIDLENVGDVSPKSRL